MKRKEAAERLSLFWESRTDKEGTVYEPLNPERLALLLKELGLLKGLKK